MSKRVKGILAAAALVSAAGATAVVAQSYEDPLTAYSYVYYADAAKTQVLGETSDRGCGGFGNNVYVLRAYIPSAFYDATPIYRCGGQGPELPTDW